MSRAVFLMVVLVAAMAVAMVTAEPGRPTKKLTSGATPKPYLNANGCMVEPVCPPCPQPATLADEPKVSAAATTYAMAHGDDDETADMTVRDVLRPAFLEGVKFSDDTVRADRRIAVLKYKAMVVQKNAVLEKQLKIAPKTGKNKKACAIPKALVCRCRSELPVASEKETLQHAFGYSVAHGDGDAHYNWDLEGAVRRSFMAGVAYADRERHVRKAINEVPLTKGTDAAMRKELNERIKALNSKENDAKSVNTNKANAYGDV